MDVVWHQLDWNGRLLQQAADCILQLATPAVGRPNSVKSAANAMSIHQPVAHSLKSTASLDTREQQTDLSRFLVVVPGSRAVQQLLLRLTESVSSDDRFGRRLWAPPDVITVGELPERLYRPKRPFATASDQQLAWLRAIQAVDSEHLKWLVPTLPPLTERAFWLDLASTLASLSRELAADDFSFFDVRNLLKQESQHPDRKRWDVLCELQEAYLNVLDTVDLWDRQTARRVAIQRGEQEMGTDQTIVLVGSVDLSVAVRKMLRLSGTTVHVLAFGSHSDSNQFDELGCLNVDHWHQEPIEVAPESLVVVDSPTDQASAVAGLYSHLTDQAIEAEVQADELKSGNHDGEPGRGHASNRMQQRMPVSIALLDHDLVSHVQRQLETFKQPSRWLGGELISSSAPFRLLEAIAQFCETNRFADFAALVRHPDLKHWLVEQGIHPQYLHCLDRFQNHRLPLNIVLDEKQASTKRRQQSFSFLEEGASANELDENSKRPTEFDETGTSSLKERSTREKIVNQLLAKVSDLIHPLRCRSKNWSKFWNDVVGTLSTVYSQMEIDRENVAEYGTGESIRRIASLIDDIRLVPSELQDDWEGFEAVNWLLRCSQGNSYASFREPNQIDLLGWLDLPWEDCDDAVVAGFNEGLIPSPVQNELILPESLRSQLGIDDHKRRFARDAYALNLLLHSKRSVRLVIGRRDQDGNPKIPSRLLFSVTDDDIATRAKQLFGVPLSVPSELARPKHPQAPELSTPEAKQDAPNHSLEPTSDAKTDDTAMSRHRFRVPLPMPSEKVIRRLSVTRFREYLHCPYRFYLSYVLGLESVNDRLEEFQGDRFGTMMHDVLESFGKSDNRHCDDPKRIDEQLQDLLSQESKRTFRFQPMPAVAIQLEQLRRRMTAFAKDQAVRTRKGWLIWEAEISSLTAELVVNGEPFEVTGRIDRIDQHQGSGEFAILDYKSSDQVVTPEAAHRTRGEWTNLQLPLYRHLAAQLPEVSDQIQLGYYSIPRDTRSVGVSLAKWSASEFAEADDVASFVIRSIRKNKYWPPRELSTRWPDPLDVVCQVGTFDRHPDDIGDERSPIEIMTEQEARKNSQAERLSKAAE